MNIINDIITEIGLEKYIQLGDRRVKSEVYMDALLYYVCAEDILNKSSYEPETKFKEHILLKEKINYVSEKITEYLEKEAIENKITSSDLEIINSPRMSLKKIMMMTESKYNRDLLNSHDLIMQHRNFSKQLEEQYKKVIIL